MEFIEESSPKEKESVEGEEEKQEKTWRQGMRDLRNGVAGEEEQEEGRQRRSRRRGMTDPRDRESEEEEVDGSKTRQR